MTKKRASHFIPIILVFILVSVLCVAAKNFFTKWDIDTGVVLAGNTLLFAITIISFLLAQRGLNHTNPHVFVRSVYSGLMIKLFVCIIAAFIYISTYKGAVNKGGLFSCMGLYLVYTFMEVSILMKQLRSKSHEQG